MIYIKDNTNSYKNACRGFREYSLKLIEISKYKLETEYTYHVDPGDYHCAFYVISGSVKFESSRIIKKDLFFVPKFSVTSFCAEETTELIRIAFDYSNPIPILKDHKLHVIHSTSEMRSQIKKLQTLSLFKDSLPGTGEAVLLNILNDADKIAVSGSNDIALYNKTYEWIESNAQTAVSAEDAAAAMHCSREHLNRVVKTVSGCNLSTLIAKERLWAVEQLCAVKSLSAADIAQKLDFGSAELLCKFFKYHKGMSLSQYRNTM